MSEISLHEIGMNNSPIYGETAVVNIRLHDPKSTAMSSLLPAWIYHRPLPHACAQPGDSMLTLTLPQDSLYGKNPNCYQFSLIILNRNHAMTDPPSIPELLVNL